MICPKCSHTVADDEMFCKNCGAALKKSKKKEFVVNIPDEELTASARQEPEQQKESVAAAKESAEKNEQPVEMQASVNTDAADEPVENAEPDVQSEPAEALSLQTEPETAVKPALKPHPQIKRKKKDPLKKTYLAIKLIASFCAVAIIAITVLGTVTDIFEDNPNKTLVLSGLSNEQKTSFAKYASQLTALYENGYNKQITVFDDVLELMKPNSDDGLYAGFFEKKQPITDEGDPAERFKLGENSYNYCKVDEKDIEKIADSLGLKVHHDANTADYYYYDGAYYFAAKQSGEAYKKLAVHVDEAKQTQSGDYYVTCGLYPESSVSDDGTVTGEPSQKQYFLASLAVNGETDNWSVSKISDEPIIETPIVSIKDKDTDKDSEKVSTEIKSLDFEIKRESITAKTSGGDVYAEYIVEYPYFESTGITQTAINNIYSELVDSFKAQADDADKLYEKYIKEGHEKSDLPLYTHIVSNVVYNDNGYISLMERRTESTFESVAQAETTASQTSWSTSTTSSQPEQEQVTFAKTTYEGYTYVIESGDFVKKDEVLGKDYQQMYKELYELYYESKHNDVTDEEETTTSQSSWGTAQTSSIPNDSDGIGEAIYTSAWVLSKNGVIFCYQNTDGALDKVIIPYDKLENMTIKV
ncbi:MAG: hypothetical protein NC110_01440 [Ruminococcus sp.]|nr:hypothetical protein [Ruminococcus sp.]